MADPVGGSSDRIAALLARARTGRGANVSVPDTTAAKSQPVGVKSAALPLLKSANKLLAEMEVRFYSEPRAWTEEMMEVLQAGATDQIQALLASKLRGMSSRVDLSLTQEDYLKKLALRGKELATTPAIGAVFDLIYQQGKIDRSAGATAGMQSQTLSRDQVTTAVDIRVPERDELTKALDQIPGQKKAKEELRKRLAWLFRSSEKVDAKERRRKLHLGFAGPSDTGQEKTAEVYAKMLHDKGLIQRPEIKVVDLAILVADAPKEVTKNVKEELKDTNEQLVLFTNVDALDGAKHAEAIAEIAKATREDDGPIVVFAGPPDAITGVVDAHPHLKAAVTDRIPFALYDDAALLQVLEVEAEGRDLMLDRGAKQAAKGRLIGQKGDRSTVLQMLDAAEMSLADRTYGDPSTESFMLTAKDFEAADPGTAEKGSALERLQKVIGLQGVKDSIAEILALVQTNKRRQLAGKPAKQVRLHATFEGEPGTGKSTIAELYYRCLVEVGMLKGNYVLTKPSELKGDVVGAAATATIKKLKEAKGGMFFLDEAHQCKGDMYGEEIIKTVLTFMEENPDTVVIFGGYPDQMYEMLMKIDPGLQSRLADRIKFENYSDTELLQIADLMAEDSGLKLEPSAREFLGERLRMERTKQNFGNAREVRNMLDRAVRNQSSRISKLPEGVDDDALQTITREDIPGQDALLDDRDPLEGMIALEEVRAQLEELAANIDFSKNVLGEDPRQNFEPNYCLCGPPGTGKSSVAGALGRIFFKNELLPTQTVVSMTSADLLGKFVGEAKNLTEDALKKALGGVLVLDEISGLVKGNPQFRSEVIGKLLDFMEKNRGKLSVVIAGYEQDINAFLALDPGLSRRFGNRLNFRAFTPTEAVDCFDFMLNKKISLSDEARQALPIQMAKLASAPNWSNAGDVRTVAGEVVRQQGVWHSRNKRNTELDFKVVPKEVLEEAFAKLIRKKELEAGLRSTASVEDPTLQMQQDYAKKAEVKHEHKHAVGVRQKILEQLEVTIKDMGLTQEEALAMIKSGKAGKLANELAKKLGMDPDQIAGELEDLAKEVEEQAKLNPSQWMCMFCGSQNPNCPYKDLPDREQYNALKDQ